MTRYANEHPGGSFLIQNLAGADGTEQFQSHHKKKGSWRFGFGGK
jgi:cytochrome b involved in lipid metabolism